MQENLEKKEVIEVEVIEEVKEIKVNEIKKERKTLKEILVEAKNKVETTAEKTKNKITEVVDRNKDGVVKGIKTTSYVLLAAPVHAVWLGLEGVAEKTVELATGKSIDMIKNEKELKRINNKVKDFAKRINKAENDDEKIEIFYEAENYLKRYGIKVEEVLKY